MQAQNEMNSLAGSPQDQRRQFARIVLSRLPAVHATFDWPASDDAQQPWGHFQNRSGPQPHDPHDSYHLPACLAPGGGISMSIEDYAKFFRLHLQGLRGHDGLLRAKTIQYLHEKPEGADENSIGFAFG